jgi:tetratricopeptide (TPR) repeat protein
MARAESRGKKSRKPRRAARPREGQPAPPPTNGDWGELYDRAAKKISELADAAGPAAEAARKMAVDLSEGIDSAFAKVSAQARDLMAKGQHTRVRIKFRGKQIAELPIAVVAAAEVASFWWFGPLRVVLGHVVGKAVLDVEFVSNADLHVAEGRRLLADGEMEKALAEFDRALAIDRRCAGAHLGRGIALKLRGDKEAARSAFAEAEQNDPRGEVGREARRHLDNL